jgi:nitroimidazol reductase NimA-like FMN-containing flavoprotein (pyridoxamine 5'-phosphate oxidase superfamily)
MPDYGVDTPAWTPLAWSWAVQRLLANRNFWVVTVSAHGRPHALPVWGVWDEGENRFAFSCGPRSRKAQNLKANPQVAIMTEDTVECISLEGRAAPVQDSERQEVWIDRYLTKYRPLSADLSAEFIRQNVVVEFEPDRALAVIEREAEFATRATRWRFERRP